MSCQETPHFGDFHNDQQPSCDRAGPEMIDAVLGGAEVCRPGSGAAGPTLPTSDTALVATVFRAC